MFFSSVGLMIPFYTVLSLVKLMTDLKLTNSILGMVLYYCGRNVPMASFYMLGLSGGFQENFGSRENDGPMYGHCIGKYYSQL